MKNSVRNRKILALYGKKSFGMIAKQLGISRNVVAGVVFRDTYPPRHRIPSPNGGGGQQGRYRASRPRRLCGQDASARAA